MAFQSVPATAEAVVQYIVNGLLVTNTFYFKQPVAYDLDALEELAAAVDEWVGTEWLPVFIDGLTYSQTVVRGLESENDFEVNDDTSAGTGTITGSNPSPNNVTFAVKRLSGLTGRSARGRIYVPTIGTGQFQAVKNFIPQALADDWVNALSDQISYTGSLGWSPVIVSRYTGGSPRLFGVTFPITQWAYTDLRTDSRRDRLPQE